MSNQPLLELLQRESIQQRCESVYETFGMLTLTVSKENLLALCHLLKHDSALQFNFLSDICGVDHYPQTPRFETVYHVLDAEFDRYADIQHAVNVELLRRFAAEKIEFAFPARTVILKRELQPT